MLSKETLKRMRVELQRNNTSGGNKKPSEKSDDVKRLSLNSSTSSFGSSLSMVALGSSQSLNSMATARGQKRRKSTEISKAITDFIKNLDTERVITNEERAVANEETMKFENELTC
mmetsp:Transcript_7622/g.10849  ORF Transcript_7622/g.10849 Transcript_7622/m.10849 type:complete len:116 (-) Transcript_7622:67-414(-)